MLAAAVQPAGAQLNCGRLKICELANGVQLIDSQDYFKYEHPVRIVVGLSKQMSRQPINSRCLQPVW